MKKVSKTLQKVDIHGVIPGAPDEAGKNLDTGWDGEIRVHCKNYAAS